MWPKKENDTSLISDSHLKTTQVRVEVLSGGTRFTNAPSQPSAIFSRDPNIEPHPGGLRRAFLQVRGWGLPVAPAKAVFYLDVTSRERV